MEIALGACEEACEEYLDLEDRSTGEWQVVISTAGVMDTLPVEQLLRPLECGCECAAAGT